MISSLLTVFPMCIINELEQQHLNIVYGVLSISVIILARLSCRYNFRWPTTIFQNWRGKTPKECQRHTEIEPYGFRFAMGCRTNWKSE